MQNEKGTGQEAWKVVADRMAAASRIASQCNTHTAMVYDRLVLEELRAGAEAHASTIREFVAELNRGGAL